MQIKVGEESKMAKDQRFEKVYSQGMLETTEIWVDKTPLLDSEGKPVVSSVWDK